MSTHLDLTNINNVLVQAKGPYAVSTKGLIRHFRYPSSFTCQFLTKSRRWTVALSTFFLAGPTQNWFVTLYSSSVQRCQQTFLISSSFLKEQVGDHSYILSSLDGERVVFQTMTVRKIEIRLLIQRF